MISLNHAVDHGFDQWMLWDRRIRDSRTHRNESDPTRRWNVRDLLGEYVNPGDQIHMSTSNEKGEESQKGRDQMKKPWAQGLTDANQQMSLGSFRKAVANLRVSQASQQLDHNIDDDPIYPGLEFLLSVSSKTVEAFLQSAFTPGPPNVTRIHSSLARCNHDRSAAPVSTPSLQLVPSEFVATELLRVSTSIVEFQEKILQDLREKSPSRHTASTAGLTDDDDDDDAPSPNRRPKSPPRHLHDSHSFEVVRSTDSNRTTSSFTPALGPVETALAQCSSNLITVPCPECDNTLLATPDLIIIFCPLCGCSTTTDAGSPISSTHAEELRGNLLDRINS